MFLGDSKGYILDTMDQIVQLITANTMYTDYKDCDSSYVKITCIFLYCLIYFSRLGNSRKNDRAF